MVLSPRQIIFAVGARTRRRCWSRGRNWGWSCVWCGSYTLDDSDSSPVASTGCPKRNVTFVRLSVFDLKRDVFRGKKTRLPASRSSSVGPESRFLFLNPKIKGGGSFDRNENHGLKMHYKSFKAILVNVFF